MIYNIFFIYNKDKSAIQNDKTVLTTFIKESQDADKNRFSFLVWLQLTAFTYKIEHSCSIGLTVYLFVHMKKIFIL